MLAFGGINSGIFKVLLVLHILSAIVGLGAVMLNGIYGSEAKKRPGPAGRAVAEANFHVSAISEYARYAIIGFGILLVLASDKAIKFSNTWVWLAMLLFIIAIAISHAVVTPAAKKMNALMLEMEQGPPPAGGPPPQVAQMQALGQRLAASGATLNVIVVVILALMIWKPGW
ncbi:MAG TPA: DUF2269 family protein [Acidimicrobiia bacterium]|jgi:uncharacterized membrane protein|nr:DUF2269 family protein [Acidimicrobiia bacterium]